MRKQLLLLLLIVVYSFQTFSQKSDLLRIGFWNVENFFDPKNDSIKADDDFTPKGLYRWTYTRFEEKKNHIYKVLFALSQGKMPILLGVCEIENRWVLNELCNNTPLSKYNYKYIHFESPDTRGIDVALLYSTDVFTPIESKPIRITFPHDSRAKTRDILFVKGTVFKKEKLAIFIVHFPSKRGGKEAAKRREHVANVLSVEVNKVLKDQIPVIIMGDFNEEHHSKILKETLGASDNIADSKPLYNLMSGELNRKGSYKYQGKWSAIDQIMVSKNLSFGERIQIKGNKAYIFCPDFLTTPDEKYQGIKPFRTYNGIKYIGGFSDHFPVYIDLEKIKE